MIGTVLAGFGACLLILQALLFVHDMHDREQPISGFTRAIAFAMQTLLRPGYRHGKELLHLQCNLYHALRLTGLPSLDLSFTVGHRYSTAANEEHLLVRKEAGLGRITVNRPKALNAKNCGARMNKCLHRQTAV